MLAVGLLAFLQILWHSPNIVRDVATWLEPSFRKWLVLWVSVGIVIFANFDLEVALKLANTLRCFIWNSAAIGFLLWLVGCCWI